MKTMLAKVKNSKGFVSLEVIAIAVIVIALAAFIMIKFRGTAQTQSENVDKQINASVKAVNEDAGKTTPNVQE